MCAFAELLPLRLALHVQRVADKYAFTIRVGNTTVRTVLM